MKRIYLAGFDVFYSDASARGARMKALCAQAGMQGLFPLDNEASGAEEIFLGNTGLLDSADAVLANLNPFRGAEPDSGTCFEIGYAAAKGIPVFAYLADGRTMKDKLGSVDENGFSVEDFGLPVNLMLACSSTVVTGDFESCLAILAKNLEKAGQKA